jgi:hypothetical protein
VISGIDSGSYQVMVMIASTELAELAPAAAPQLLPEELAAGLGQLTPTVIAPAATARVFPEELDTVTL